LLETSGIAHARGWAYLPLVELLQKYFGVEPDDDEEKRRDKIENRLTSLDPALLDTVAYLHALLGVPEADDPIAGMDRQLRKQRTLDAIKRLLVRESLAQPLMLIFEDLHWFDNESVEFLTLLSDAIATLPILMLVNYRPEFVHNWAAKSYYRQLRLDPLEADTAAELLSALMTDAEELRPFKQLIIEKSEGNPLFIEEIVRALFENGTLVRESDRVRVTRPSAEISIPATVEGIVASRIDRLPPQDKSVLQALAVIGEEFSLPVAQRALNRPEDELLRSLAYLQRSEFIYEHPTLSQTEYTFKHALIHDVAYKSVLHERRTAIHARTAEAIEVIYASHLDDHLNKLVHHFRRGGNEPKTVHYLHLAGQQAYERSAVSEAMVHFNAALETVNKLPLGTAAVELELGLQISLGDSLMSTGGFAAEGVVKAFGRARDLCGRVGDSSQLVPALFGLWAFHNFGGDLKAARELGEELLMIAGRRQDAAALLMAHTALGITLAYSGELRGALGHCTQGVSVYSPALRLPAFLAQIRSSCRTWLGLILALTGHPERAMRVTTEAVEAAEESLQTVSISNALIGASVLAAMLGDSAATKTRSGELMALATEQGFVLALSWAQVQHGYALTLEGAAEPGIAQILDGLATVRAARALTALVQSGCWLTESYLIAERTEDARQTLAEAFAAMEKTGECWYDAELHRLSGEVALRSEAPAYAEAERCFRRAIEKARDRGAKLWELRSAASLAAMLSERGRRDEAIQALTPVYASLPENDCADMRRAKSILAQAGA
jgi:predicted ATPase